MNTIIQVNKFLKQLSLYHFFFISFSYLLLYFFIFDFNFFELTLNRLSSRMTTTNNDRKKKQIVRLKREKYNIWHPTFNTNYNRYYICIYTYMNSICIYNEESFCIS